MEETNIIETQKKVEKFKKEVDTSIFYDGKRILTHNCLFNFVIGGRGLGKTFWGKKWAVEEFIRFEAQFVYVRRYAKESKKSVKSFFDDIRFLFPDHELSVKGNEFFIDGKVAGYCIVLSTAKIEKSVSYPFVNKILFDEVLIEQGHYKYLPDEVGSFLNLYETIARPGSGHCDVTVFFFSNAITWTNPYFLYFGIQQKLKPDKNGRMIWKKGEILLELCESEGFVEAKRKTRFGQIIEGTDYGDYSINNKFLLDDNTFIEKKSPDARYYFTFKYKGNTFGVWADLLEGKMWVTNAVDPSYKLIFSITMKDHEPNTMFLKNISRYPHFKAFLEYYKMGCVFFENINVKNITYEVIKMSMTI